MSGGDQSVTLLIGNLSRDFPSLDLETITRQVRATFDRSSSSTGWCARS